MLKHILSATIVNVNVLGTAWWVLLTFYSSDTFSSVSLVSLLKYSFVLCFSGPEVALIGG